MEQIQEKIELLKVKQNQIEHGIVNNIAQVLKINDAFRIDLDIMIGGILEAIDTIRSDPVKVEIWRLNGGNFRKSRIVSKKKRIKKFD
jgi:hypothetical protein